MLQGKTALITGASRGIGRETALEMARQGANVALVYAGNTEKAQKVCEEAAALGVRAQIFRCNVADFAQAEECVKQVLAAFGGVDILVNNAGITKDNLLLKMSPEDFSSVLDVNLKGAFYFTKLLYGVFMRKRFGRIINISSVAGLAGNPGQANYSSAKAGLIGLTKTTARELAARGVTANAIAPGYIETDMTAALPEAVKESILKTVPARRMGTPHDIAALAAFLASDAAGYITGEVIRADGGMCM